MLPLRDYLSQRRLAVQSEIKALRAELAEIDAAQRALNGEASAPSYSGERSKKTLKEMALEVLGAKPEGMDAAAILEAIRVEFGKVVQRESLSPQLSRLRQGGEVTNEDGLWKLATSATITQDSSEGQDPLAGVLDLDDLLGEPSGDST